MTRPRSQNFDLATVDLWIRQGQSRRAQRALQELIRSGSARKIDPTTKLALARLCRRSGLFMSAIRLLHPTIRPTGRNTKKATPWEQAEYAASLAQIGGEAEARSILDHLNPSEVPESLLFGAYARFSRWDYSAALPLLRRYVKHPSLEPYARLVGEVNLAAALVSTGQFNESDPLLEHLAKQAIELNLPLILGNARLLQAEALIERNQLAAASEVLEESERRSGEGITIDSLLVSKWKAILALRRDGLTSKNRQLFNHVRELALTRGHWETLRDCDFHEALLTQNRELLRRVYRGTPFESYRKRIELHQPELAKELSEPYVWMPGANHAKTNRSRAAQNSVQAFDLFSDAEGLKPGQVLWRLSFCLLSDFYRRQPVAGIYLAISHGAHFNPETSPTVIHQAIRRLRRHFAETRSPLEIRESHGSYRLSIEEGTKSGILIPGQAQSNLLESPSNLHWKNFLASYGGAFTEFTRHDVESRLEISRRAAAYELKTWLTSGWIEVLGAGPRRRYRPSRTSS